MNPVARQMTQIRNRYPDTIILCRLGDFVEAYAQDAVTVSQVLDTSTAQRTMNDGSRGMVTGFPYRALDASVAKLIDAGHAVALCEHS